MLGAIIGDVIGSVYEHRNIKTVEFDLFSDNCRFTDDSVMSIAVAEAIMSDQNYEAAMQKFGRLYPNAGYGGNFYNWLFEDNPKPYNSWGNGSAMRVSPVGWAFNSEAEVLAQAKASSEVTHNHPEGIKGAQAVALAIFLARNKNTKETIKKEIAGRFKYDLNRTLAQIRPSYRFDVSCQGSVPEAIIAFLESNCFEDAVRKAVSLGGDSDTIACIAGAIAEAYYQSIPAEIEENTLKRLDPTLQKVVENFVSRFVQRNKKCRLSFED